MNNYQLMFMFCEIYILRVQLNKKFSVSTICEFRHLLMNYINNTQGLQDFYRCFRIGYINLSGELYKICRHFKRYLDKFLKGYENML